MRTWMVGALGATMIFLGSATAGAEPTARERVEAKRLFEKGVHLYEAGDAENARLAYQDAYKIAPSPQLTWNLAMVQIKTHHWVEAVPLLREAIDEPRNDEARKKTARDYIAKMLSYIGRIEIHPAATSPIYVDGEKAVIDGGTVIAMPGTHTLRVEAETRSVSVEQGALAVVNFSSAEGRVPAVQPPPAPVAEKTATAPPVAPSPLPSPGIVTAIPREATGMHPARRDHTLLTATFVVGGGALLMGAGYVVAALETQSKGQSALQMSGSLPPAGCPAAAGCQGLKSEWDSRRSWGIAADTLGVASAALALSTGVLAGALLLSKSDTDRPHDAAFVPVLAPGFAGLSFSRTF